MCKRQIKSWPFDWIESDSKRVEDSKNENVLPKQINIKWKRKNKKKWKDWKRWRQKLVSDPQFVEYFCMMSTVACRHKQKRQRKNEFLFRLCLERCLYTIYCDFIIVHIHTPYSISNVCLWLYVCLCKASIIVLRGATYITEPYLCFSGFDSTMLISKYTTLNTYSFDFMKFLLQHKIKDIIFIHFVVLLRFYFRSFGLFLFRLCLLWYWCRFLIYGFIPFYTRWFACVHTKIAVSHGLFSLLLPCSRQPTIRLLCICFCAVFLHFAISYFQIHAKANTYRALCRLNWPQFACFKKNIYIYLFYDTYETQQN